jgi:hypothetical protein
MKNLTLHSIYRFSRLNAEALIWTAVLLWFAVIPVPAGSHFSVCPLHLAGFDYCSGCGLGRSLVLLLHGRISESLALHPFGILALPLLTERIVVVFKSASEFSGYVPKKDKSGAMPIASS